MSELVPFRCQPRDQEGTTVNLPTAAFELADRVVLCWLATADLSGVRNVSPKETFVLRPPATALIANIASPKAAGQHHDDRGAAELEPHRLERQRRPGLVRGRAGDQHPADRRRCPGGRIESGRYPNRATRPLSRVLAATNSLMLVRGVAGKQGR